MGIADGGNLASACPSCRRRGRRRRRYYRPHRPRSGRHRPHWAQLRRDLARSIHAWRSAPRHFEDPQGHRGIRVAVVAAAIRAADAVPPEWQKPSSVTLYVVARPVCRRSAKVIVVIVGYPPGDHVIAPLMLRGTCQHIAKVSPCNWLEVVCHLSHADFDVICLSWNEAASRSPVGGAGTINDNELCTVLRHLCIQRRAGRRLNLLNSSTDW
mmetsp:Transcript_107146/g.279781  ORF Transcript_107146/g.279781 Transcript_107146/m.279781 type:complete len:212 (+) Transcript_107146:782-1417(+)